MLRLRRRGACPHYSVILTQEQLQLVQRFSCLQTAGIVIPSRFLMAFVLLLIRKDGIFLFSLSARTPCRGREGELPHCPELFTFSR